MVQANGRCRLKGHVHAQGVRGQTCIPGGQSGGTRRVPLPTSCLWHIVEWGRPWAWAETMGLARSDSFGQFNNFSVLFSHL